MKRLVFLLAFLCTLLTKAQAAESYYFWFPTNDITTQWGAAGRVDPLVLSDDMYVWSTSNTVTLTEENNSLADYITLCVADPEYSGNFTDQTAHPGEGDNSLRPVLNSEGATDADGWQEITGHLYHLNGGNLESQLCVATGTVFNTIYLKREAGADGYKYYLKFINETWPEESYKMWVGAETSFYSIAQSNDLLFATNGDTLEQVPAWQYHFASEVTVKAGDSLSFCIVNPKYGESLYDKTSVHIPFLVNAVNENIDITDYLYIFNNGNGFAELQLTFPAGMRFTDIMLHKNSAGRYILKFIRGEEFVYWIEKNDNVEGSIYNQLGLTGYYGNELTFLTPAEVGSVDWLAAYDFGQTVNLNPAIDDRSFEISVLNVPNTTLYAPVTETVDEVVDSRLNGNNTIENLAPADFVDGIWFDLTPYLAKNGDGKLSVNLQFTESLSWRSAYTKKEWNETEGRYHYFVKFDDQPVTAALLENISLHMWHGEIAEDLDNYYPAFTYSHSDSDYAYYKMPLSKQVDISYVIQLNFWVNGWDMDMMFDARDTDCFIPVETNPYFDNSRIKVGLKIKSLWVRVNLNAESNEGKYSIYLSSTDEINTEAPAQTPVNSNNYALLLGEGPVYDALKGTQSGSIVVPFTKHNQSDNVYVINLGKKVTIPAGGESFALMVNSQMVNVNFAVNGDDEYYQGQNGGAMKSWLGSGSTFNRILLRVSGSNFENFDMWLANDAEPADYNSTRYSVPALKIWTGDNGNHGGGFFNIPEDKLSMKDGSVNYYNFSPVEGNPNLFYLDFGAEGIVLNEDGTPDIFNIMNLDGYDSAVVFQGGQAFYNNTWWCANPKLINWDTDGNITLNPIDMKINGDYFTEGDLFFGGDPNATTVSATTVYGITLFQIVGRKYNYYADTESTDGIVDGNIYYLYFNTDPSKVGTPERTCPILLNVFDKEANQVKGANGAELLTYTPAPFTDAAGTVFNSPEFKGGEAATQIMLTQSNVALQNVDANYSVDLSITPADNSFQFVDVTGTQRWLASSSDALRANRWSNYYSGSWTDDNAQEAIAIQQPGVEYYRAVLATNLDQARYQILSLVPSVDTQAFNQYKSTAQGQKNENHKDNIIYPGSDIYTEVTWTQQSDLKVTLTFTEPDGTQSIKEFTFAYSEIDSLIEQGVLTELTADDTFLEEGETRYRIDLGQWLLEPGTKVEVTTQFGDTLPVSSGSVPTHTLPDTEILDLASLPSWVLSSTEDNHTYSSDLYWNYPTNDYPRYYTLYTYDAEAYPDLDLSTQEMIDQAIADGILTVVEKEYAGNETFKESATIENATTFGNGHDGEDGSKLVTIGYAATMTYTYAYPADGPAEWTEATQLKYSEVTEGYISDTVTSDPSTSTSDFIMGSRDNNTIVGVDQIQDEPEVKVYGTTGALKIEAPAETIAEIYSLSGTVIYTGRPGVVELQSGIYVVRVAGSVWKVTVR